MSGGAFLFQQTARAAGTNASINNTKPDFLATSHSGQDATQPRERHGRERERRFTLSGKLQIHVDESQIDSTLLLLFFKRLTPAAVHLKEKRQRREIYLISTRRRCVALQTADPRLSSSSASAHAGTLRARRSRRCMHVCFAAVKETCDAALSWHNRTSQQGVCF